MSKIQADWRKFTFIDFGSGAGRVLILASAYPFRAIRGIELSSVLHDLAVRNPQRHLQDDHACDDIASICEDAESFPIPRDDLVIYMYNPFEGALFEKIIGKIAEAQAESRRQVFIVSCHPADDSVIERSGRFRRIYEGYHGHNVWHVYEAIETVAR